MKAVICHESALAVVDVPTPVPAAGQVLLRVTGCGICGSDLHARHHADAQADVLAEAGYDSLMRSSHRVVLGHELSGEILEHGAGSRAKLRPGTPVVALPLRRDGDTLHPIGLSAAAPGAYAEQVLVEDRFMFAVPNGLPAHLAALTEPMAIGYHAVRRSEVAKKDVAVVIGCGPVGLAVVCALKARGVATIVASDYSPARRRLAQACGADVVVDPAESSPWDRLDGHGHLRTVPDAVGLAFTTMGKLERLPVPWHHVWHALERLGAASPKRPVVFECVGVPGVIDDIISRAPLFTRVVVVGVCMQPDTIRPAMAVNKEIDLRFVVGYTPIEFRDTLYLLADGKLDAAPLLTGEVGLDGVAAAFDALKDPDEHAKIMIRPDSHATAPVSV